MKRNETVDLMLEFERSASSYKCGRKFMSDLLQVLEDAGMQPESYEGLTRNGVRFVREEHAGYDTMLVRNRWEPVE